MRLDPAGGKKLDGGLSLAEGYELCRRVQKAHSRTYYFSTSLFPAEVRPQVHALYAFMRYADEIVDNPHDRPLRATSRPGGASRRRPWRPYPGRRFPTPSCARSPTRCAVAASTPRP